MPASPIALLVYQVSVAVTRRRNPLSDELYTHLRTYREVVAGNTATPVEAEDVALAR